MKVRVMDAGCTKAQAQVLAMELASVLDTRIREYVLGGRTLQVDALSAAQECLGMLTNQLPEDCRYLQRLQVVFETFAHLASPTLFAAQNREFAELVGSVDDEMAALGARVLTRPEFLCQQVALPALEACRPIPVSSALKRVPNLSNWVKRQNLESYPGIQKALKMALFESPSAGAICISELWKWTLLKRFCRTSSLATLKEWLLKGGAIAMRVQAASELEAPLAVMQQFTTEDWAEILVCGLPDCLLPIFLVKPEGQLRDLLCQPKLHNLIWREWESKLPELLSAAYPRCKHYVPLLKQVYCESFSEEIAYSMNLIEALVLGEACDLNKVLIERLTRFVRDLPDSFSPIIKQFVAQRCSKRGFDWVSSEAMFWGYYLERHSDEAFYLRRLRWTLDAMTEFAVRVDFFPIFKTVAFPHFDIKLFVQSCAASRDSRILLKVLDAYPKDHAMWSEIDWSDMPSDVCYAVFPRLSNKQLRAYAASRKTLRNGTMEHYSIAQARVELEDRALAALAKESHN